MKLMHPVPIAIIFFLEISMYLDAKNVARIIMNHAFKKWSMKLERADFADPKSLLANSN